jgi:hypothetical protein
MKPRAHSRPRTQAGLRSRHWRSPGDATPKIRRAATVQDIVQAAGRQQRVKERRAERRTDRRCAEVCSMRQDALDGGQRARRQKVEDHPSARRARQDWEALGQRSTGSTIRR